MGCGEGLTGQLLLQRRRDAGGVLAPVQAGEGQATHELPAGGDVFLTASKPLPAPVAFNALRQGLQATLFVQGFGRWQAVMADDQPAGDLRQAPQRAERTEYTPAVEAIADQSGQAILAGRFR